MKKILFAISIFYFWGCSSFFHTGISSEPHITYYVDVSNHADDLFHVTVTTSIIWPLKIVSTILPQLLLAPIQF